MRPTGDRQRTCLLLLLYALRAPLSLVLPQTRRGDVRRDDLIPAPAPFSAFSRPQPRRPRHHFFFSAWQDGSGSIDFEEFLNMMTAKMSDKDTREDINKVFNLFDDDQTGHITLRNLKRVAKELGETMSGEWRGSPSNVFQRREPGGWRKGVYLYLRMP